MESSLSPRSVKNRATSGAAGESDLQVPALERGLAVLELLAASPEGLTLAEIGAALELSNASIFRIANALDQLGYLRRDERTKRFFLSKKLLLLGQPQAEGRSLVECCVDSMRRVLQATGETTQLCCLAEGNCVIVDQLPSIHPFKYIVDLGSRAPAHCAAPGKAMLAYLPDGELDALLPRLVFKAHTERTITSAKAFRVEIERIRASGYAIDHGEHFDGINCVAAPLLNRHGHAVAAITIAGPSSRIPEERFAEYGRLIIDAAQKASDRFHG